MAVGLGLSGCGDDDDDHHPATDAGVDARGEDGGEDEDGGGGDPLHVETAEGPVQGIERGATRAFLGIPYAAPPVGDLRWRAPAPVAPWDEPLVADELGAECPQRALLGEGWVDGTSEDCLTLNVWSPEGARGAPVMFFIHGGGFINGSSAIDTYDGQHLAEAGGVVVVTINYRLGPLGYLSHEAIDDDDDGAAGAYGFADQQAALDWVARNAAAFGGDPENVTIFGESAGAMSAWLHLVAPGSQGKFGRAVLESGIYADGYRTMEGARLRSEALADAVGCTGQADVAACLRAKTSQELFEAPLGLDTVGFLEAFAWLPAVGGAVLPEQPSEVVADGRAAPVPIVIGTNRNEGTFFIRGSFGGIDAAEYAAVIEEQFGAKVAAQILARYPAEGETAEPVFAEAFGDFVFVCPTRRLVRALAVSSDDRFLYSFERPVELAVMPGLGSFHAAELMFVFGTDFVDGLATLSDEDLPLSAAIQGYWSRFAATGDPNGGDAVAWPSYDEASDEHLTLDLVIAAGSGHKDEVCDFWDGIPF